MGLKDLNIQLDNCSEVYYPGQTVNGKVSFWITEKCHIEGIELKADGKSKVKWAETHAEFVSKDGKQQIEKETEIFQSEENYFQYSAALMTQNGCNEIEEGNYEYPFSFQLSDHLPPTFEGQFGKIRYVIKATAYGTGDLEYNAKVPIIIKTRVDLNDIEIARQPIQATDTKTIGFWCCASGPITANVSIDRIGYVPEQSIALTATVDNQSGKIMKGSKVLLVQTFTFHARGKTKVEETILWEQKRGPFEKSELWDRVPILIPDVIPSELHVCTNIIIAYHLQFSVDPGTFSFDLKIPLNIIIGNVPLKDVAPTAAHSEQPSNYEEVMNGKNLEQSNGTVQ